MNKFYIDENKGRKYYAYEYQNDQVKYISLEDKDILTLLSSISEDRIREIHDQGKSMEVTFSNGITLIIDNLKIFFPHHDFFDHYFEKLLNQLNAALEKSNWKDYKEKLTKNHTPTVNRKKKSKLPTKTMITAWALSFSIAISCLASSLGKQKIEEQNLKEEHEISYSVPKVSMPELPIEQTNPSSTLESESKIQVELAFNDESASGKLEQTIKNCAPYLDEWIERYGLPKDLTYALVCQESGTFDLTINSLGSVGPMQLQVDQYHNENAIEKITVPVYENGVLTGKYDEFYVADARHLDDPRLEGKNYLVMQNLEDNFQIGCAVLRRCIDRYKNIFVAIDAYNKGLYCLSNCCTEEKIEQYKNDFEDFSWISIITNAKGINYGDPNYLWNVLRYLDTGVRGEANIQYYYGDELINVDLINTNVYNNELKK